VSAELAGSGVPGSLLDSNLTTGLIHHSLNSEVLGRYLFPIRTNVYTPGPPFGDRGDPRTSVGSAPASSLHDGEFRTRRSISPSRRGAWTGVRAATAAASAQCSTTGVRLGLRGQPPAVGGDRRQRGRHPPPSQRLEGDVVRLDGLGRADLYVRNPDGSYTALTASSAPRPQRRRLLHGRDAAGTARRTPPRTGPASPA
jgi:hypothetical protein